MADEPLGHYIAAWCTEDDIPPSRVDRIRDVDLGLAIGAATDLLYVMSGRQFRSGRSVVRPTALNSGWWYQNSLYPYSSMSGYGSAWGWAAGWAWTAIGQGWWQTGQDSAECVLQGNVRKINSVMVDGAVLPPSAYTLYDARRLVRMIDPTGQTSGAWPWEQNLQLSLDQPGTWCVDEHTEILTSRGWKRYAELFVNEPVYVLDTETGLGRFEPLRAVNVFRGRHKVRRLETVAHSSLSTIDHRWFVWQEGRPEWRTSDRLTKHSGLLHAAALADPPLAPKWSDEMVELIAWFWTEGHLERLPSGSCRITIAQSESANPQHVAAIRRALDFVFPGGWSITHDTLGRVRFRLRVGPSGELATLVEPGSKAPLPHFLLALTRSQLALMIERCLDGDGHRTASGTRSWLQKNEVGVRRFEMLCALAGIGTNTRRVVNTRSKRAAWLVTLLRSTRTYPVAATRRTEPRIWTRPIIDETVDYDGVVWCPVTPSGTWLARRNGTVYFTGNSIDYEWGKSAGDLGKVACIELAVEIALGLSGIDDLPSKLPARVVSIATQGLTVAVGNPIDYLREELTGIPLVDMFLNAYNPGKLRRRSAVYAPNSTALRETTPGVGLA